jgi:hypothetical protein
LRKFITKDYFWEKHQTLVFKFPTFLFFSSTVTTLAFSATTTSPKSWPPTTQHPCKLISSPVIGTTTTSFSFPPQTSSSSYTITIQPPTLSPSSHQTSDGSRNPYTKWASSSPSPLLSAYRMWNNSRPPIGGFC